MKAGTEGSALTTREERTLRKTLEGKLEDAGVPDARAASRALGNLGIATDVEPYLAILTSDLREPLLRGAFNVASMERNAVNIRTAADRAAKIVFALKHYAHPGDAAGHVVKASLSENLETVLTLYHYQIKQGVEVIRRLDDAAEVYGRHDELNQVWTNLVHNALQVMQYKGVLEVEAQQQEDSVVVRIVDNGPGIPTDVRDRIFEPFYTTKSAGEGTGLGLSISRRIIDQHEGTIDVDTKPGRTVFSVTLPIRRPGDE